MAYKKLSLKGGSGILHRIFRLQLVTIYLAVIMLGFSVWSWWQYAYSSPNRVFWDMVDKSLSTTSFTKKVVQNDGQQIVTQITDSQLTPKQIVNSQTNIKQSGPDSAEVITQSVGTPAADYVRYVKVQTAQKGQSGQPLDFSSILNVWGKSPQMGDKTNGQLFNETVLSVVPFANLTQQQRAKLVKLMKDTNVYNYSLDRKASAGVGRYNYIYKVDLNPQAYISLLKAYATETGLNQLEAVDPAQYASAQPVSVELSIDSWSHQLNAISFGGGSRIERISGYGSLKKVQGEPAKSVPVDELQTKLQSVSTQ